MSDENPTGGDAGASIQDRMVNFLSAGETPEKKPEPAASSAAPDAGNSDDAAPQGDGDNADSNADTPAEGEPGDIEGPQVTTADLAKMLGIDEGMLDVDDDGNATIKTKIDGKDGTAKLSDFVKSYQMQGHVDNQSREVAQLKQAAQQRLADADQAAAAKLSQLDDVIGFASQELMREFQGIDWATLRVQQPGEYSALLADFQGRQQKLANLSQASQQEKAGIQQRQSETMQSFLNEEAAKLPTVIPEWKDKAVMGKESAEIKQWALGAGFSQQEIQSLSRSAHVATMRKAMLFDRLQSGKSVIEAKVRAAPRLVKPGQAQTQTRQQQSVRNIRDNVRKSGGSNDAVAAFLMAAGKV